MPQRNILLPRLTGLAYLVIIGCGIFAEGYSRGRLIVPKDAAGTASQIAADLGLFRAGIVADSVMLLADVTVAVLFFRLLRPHGARLAQAAMGLRLLQAATILAGLSRLWLVGPALAADDPARVLALIEAHGLIYDVGLIFFAGNCLAMSVLLRRSGGVPKGIAWGIGASGLVYATGSLTHLFAPTALAYVEPAYLVPLLSETALALWLLLRGRI